MEQCDLEKERHSDHPRKTGSLYLKLGRHLSHAWAVGLQNVTQKLKQQFAKCVRRPCPHDSLWYLMPCTENHVRLQGLLIWWFSWVYTCIFWSINQEWCITGCDFFFFWSYLTNPRWSTLLKISGPDTKMHLNIISLISMKCRVIIAHLAAEPFELVHN